MAADRSRSREIVKFFIQNEKYGKLGELLWAIESKTKLSHTFWERNKCNSSTVKDVFQRSIRFPKRRSAATSIFSALQLLERCFLEA